MARLYADIPKFKRLEFTLRKAMREYSAAIHEIDRLLSSRKWRKEAEGLSRLRAECELLFEQSRLTVRQVYDCAFDEPLEQETPKPPTNDDPPASLWET